MQSVLFVGEGHVPPVIVSALKIGSDSVPMEGYWLFYLLNLVDESLVTGEACLAPTHTPPPLSPCRARGDHVAGRRGPRHHSISQNTDIHGPTRTKLGGDRPLALELR